MYFNHKNGIVLRKACESDLNFLKEVKSQVFWGMHSNLFINDDDFLSWFGSLTNKDILLVGIKNDQPIGMGLISNIDNINRKAHVSGALHKKHRAFGSNFFCAGVDFCFEFLNLERLEAEVIAYNYPAYKIEVGQIGFQVEGIKRKSVYKCGEKYDSLVLGLLREEWASSQRVLSYNGSCSSDFDHEFARKIESRLTLKHANQRSGF